MLNKTVSEVHGMERTEAQVSLTATALMTQAVSATKAAAGGHKAGRTDTYLVVDEPVVKDAVHVPAEPLQATILGPDIGVAGGHQPFHGGLQVAQQLPVLLPAEEHSGLPTEQQIYCKRSFRARCTPHMEILVRPKLLVVRKAASGLHTSLWSSPVVSSTRFVDKRPYSNDVHMTSSHH